MKPIPIHGKIYTVTITVDSQDNLTVVEADPEILAILETNSLRDLCDLPAMWGRYKVELKFWFFDDAKADPYVVKFGFDVLNIQRLLP